MRLDNEVRLDFKDVLIVPKRSTLSSRADVSLIREYDFRYSKHPYKGIPILASNMDTVGTIEMAEALHPFKLGVCLHKFIELDKLADHFNSSTSEYSWFSMGITDTDLLKWQSLLKKCNPIRVCIDVANGYQEQFVSFVKKMRDSYPDITIMAGNVVTGDMVQALILAGADLTKLGIGSGSVCSTRKQTGVGYPQLSAIIECADAAHGLDKGRIVSDGGCTVPGDIGKAFGAGSDFVMLGGMLAGHSECGGEILEINDEKVMKFYGMSSEEAMMKHYGKVSDHRAAEGKTVLIPFRGPVEGTIKEILGGLRSTCTYTGSKSLKELPKTTHFIRVTQQLNGVFGD